MAIAKIFDRIKCPFCGNISLGLIMCGTRIEHEFFNEHIMYFDRAYTCYNCRAKLELSTIEKTPDLNELLRKDVEWAENLKSEKN